MRCFRLFRSRYSPIDATGAFLAGGRWNQKGTWLLYTSSTLSLACLEILVHVREPRLPVDYAWSEISIPDDLLDPEPLKKKVSDQEKTSRELKTWSELIDSLPEEEALDQEEETYRQTGTDWINSMRNVAVGVPSVIIPTERNVLLNVRHPLFNQVTFTAPQPFSFDPRLLKLSPIPLP